MAVQLSAFPSFRAPDDPSKQIITDGAKFERFIRFLEDRPWLVFDYETSGTAWFKHAEAIGIALGTWDDQGRLWSAYVPFRHKTNESQLDIAIIGPALQRLLALNSLKIAHNIKFEDHMSRREGWVVNGPRYDTMVAAHLYDENRFLALESRAATDGGFGDAAFVGKRMISDCAKQYAKANKLGIKKYLWRHGYSEIPVQLCGWYANFDITHCAGLYRTYESWGVSQNYPRIWPTEMALTEVITDMEQYGIPLDIPYLENLAVEMDHEKDIRVQNFEKAMHGRFSFDFGKDVKLRTFLTDVLGMNLTKLTKGGRKALMGYLKSGGKEENFDKSSHWSVDSEVLGDASKQFSFLNEILEWREFQKIRSTYTTSLIDHCAAGDNILHSSFKQMGAATGRLSCKEPNQQNMVAGPRVRTAFIVRKGMVRLFLDYSQIELRVLAHYSRDPIMTDNYLRGGDIHKRTQIEVAEMMGLSEPIPRRTAKIINFGLCLKGNQLTLAMVNGKSQLVRLDEVRPTHLVWDGVDWVTHDGLVCRGEQEVVEYDGITATPDHVVYTEDGGKARLGCLATASPTRRIASGGDGTTPIEFDTRPNREGAADGWEVPGCGTCVWCLREDELDSSGLDPSRPDSLFVSEYGKVQGPESQDFRGALRRNGSTMYSGHSRFISKLQRTWDQSFVRIPRTLYSMGLGYLPNFGFQGIGFRSDRQRGTLRALEYEVGVPIGESKKSAQTWWRHLQERSSSFWRKFVQPPQRSAGVSDVYASLPESAPRSQTSLAKVYDLLNAGPRRRFTVSGKIVSNSYCLTDKGLSHQAKIPEAEAKVFLDKFFQKFSGITAYREHLWAESRRNDGTWSNLFGRTRRLPDLMPGRPGWMVRRAERQMIGSAIQGTAAELTKESLVRISRWLKGNQIPAYLSNTVHDEIQIDLPKEWLPYVIRGCKILMEDYPEFAPIPILTSVEVTDTNWGHKVSIVDEVREPGEMTLDEFMMRPVPTLNHMTQGVA